MKRIAAPMVGGMVSPTTLTLPVILSIYFVWRRREVKIEPTRSAELAGR